MKPKWLLVFIGLVGVVAATVVAAGLGAEPAVVTGLTGTLRVQQGVPCASDVDLTTPVIGGRLVLRR
jgi:hypothetical protein